MTDSSSISAGSLSSSVPPPPPVGVCDYCRRPRDTKNPLRNAKSYYIPWARDGGAQCSICRNLHYTHRKGVDSRTLRAELRDDQNHLQWMELVCDKEAEMNGDLPRKKHRLSGEAQSTLTHIDETVIEGSMFLGVFWPKNIYEDLTKKRLQNPTTYTHNGQKLVGIVRPSSEGCPIGCIELRQVGRYGHAVQTILERDEEGGDAQIQRTLDSLRKLSKVTVSPVIKNGEEEGYALKVGSDTKRKNEDECSFLDALWDAPISGPGGQASSSKGSKEKSSSDKATPQKCSGRSGTESAPTPSKGLTHVQKEYQAAERTIFEGNQVLQQVGAGDGWLTMSDKKIERLLCSLDKRLVPKCLELYSAQYQSDSKGMVLLSELQKMKTNLKLLLPLVKALHDKSAGDVVLNHVRAAICGGVALSENMMKLAVGRFAAVHLEALEFDKWASCLLDTERPDGLMMLFPSERRAELQAELVGAGLLQLLILENGVQSVIAALEQLLLRKVLHPAMETEIIQLNCLSRCHEVGVAKSEEAMEFFVNHPHRRLHMGVKLFPTGLLLKSVVAAAKAQSIADQRLESDIVKFGTKFATLGAPSALAQDGAGVWILQQDDRLQLKAAHQELAVFRTMGSTTLLQKHSEVIAKAEACIEAAAKMLSEKNVNRFVDKANVPLQKLSTVLDTTAAADTPRVHENTTVAETSTEVQNTAVAESESLASGFKDAEGACKVPIDQMGLSDIASAEVCSKLQQEFADASRALAKLRVSAHCMIQQEDLCDKLLLGAVDVAHEPPALLSKVPGFSPFKASFQKSCGRSILARFCSKQQKGARSDSNRVAALVVLGDTDALDDVFSAKVSATSQTMSEKDLKSEAAFQLLFDTKLASFCDDELNISVVFSDETVQVPVGVATRMPQVLAIAQRLGELSQNVDEKFRSDCLQQVSECLLKVSETLQHVKEWRGKVEFAQPIITTQLLRLTEHAVRTVLNGYDTFLKGLGTTGEQLTKQDALLRMQTLLDGNFNGDEHGSMLMEIIAEDDAQQIHALYKEYRQALRIDIVQLRDTVEKVCGKTFDDTWAQLDDAAAIFAKEPLTCVATLTAVQALFKEHAAKPDGTDRKTDIITATMRAMNFAKPPLQPHPKLSLL